ncbi:hypothetical protein ZOSMA_182G00310 [Zostera marina]|uniref:Uncharacterized protein n=1 Tax=Zostera marina TaxID=29655 RepID=A0A0K9PQU3_ZOSMR|nr:hypothetical protein ZOSMA_182G00310 [Zostera marina]
MGGATTAYFIEKEKNKDEFHSDAAAAAATKFLSIDCWISLELVIIAAGASRLMSHVNMEDSVLSQYWWRWPETLFFLSSVIDTVVWWFITGIESVVLITMISFFLVFCGGTI